MIINCAEEWGRKCFYTLFSRQFGQKFVVFAKIARILIVPMPMFSVKTWWMFWTEKKFLDIKVFTEECFTVLSNPSSWDRIFSVSFILFHYKTCRFSKLKGLEYWERELISLLTVENKYTNVVFSLLSSQSKADQNYDSIPTPPNTKKLRWDIVFYEYNIG